MKTANVAIFGSGMLMFTAGGHSLVPRPMLQAVI